MIVNISSTNGQVVKPFLSAYSASKKSLDCFSEVLSKELCALGVKTNSIDPGMMKTEFVFKTLIINPQSAPYYKDISNYVSFVQGASKESQVKQEDIVNRIKMTIFSNA